MLCCEKCFNDDYIKEYIKDYIANKKKAINARCDVCGAQGSYCIEIQTLASSFGILLNYYTISKDNGRQFIEILLKDWNIFNVSVNRNKIKKFLQIIFNNVQSYKQNQKYDTNQTILCENWGKFNREIKGENRFFFKEILPLELLEKMLQYLETPIKKDSPFFRARIEPSELKFSQKDMKKPPNNALPGRANPKNISYFYLASNNDTALHEIRPFDQDVVAVAKFTANKDFRVIDLRNISPFLFIKDDDCIKLSQHIPFLKMLSDELSKPIHPNDKEIEYLPTQYLSGFIKNRGWDGVLYRSSIMKQGYNLVMFDDNDFVFNSMKKYKITNFEFAKKEL
jgi:hypothetical protein